ncbi:MAG: hypothetical protein IKZ53_02770 [Selenomonadaceae bacterium]|nr:hypothetical protein [Selenomonadaceae bacterium]
MKKTAFDYKFMRAGMQILSLPTRKEKILEAFKYDSNTRGGQEVKRRNL